MHGNAMLAVLAAAIFVSGSAYGQVCQIEYKTWNKNRKVPGPVNEECRSGEIHSPPFGNWGVETETSARYDGFQFAGWCRYKTVCKTNDPEDCWTACQDDWFEWNSCTTDRAEFRAPNSTMYNDGANDRQKSAGTGTVNSHGVGTVTVSVSCPVDNDGDYYPDEGGCLDAMNYDFSLSGHRMELWELDHWRPWDDYVGTMYFGILTAPTDDADCDVYGCSGDDIGTYRSPYGGTSAVSASAAVQVLGATFIDRNGVCCDPEDDSCD